MNKWMILGATLGVLVVAIVLAAMNLEAWLDENRPMIEEQAGSAIGRDVTLGDLGVQIWGGLGVSVEGVRIAEDPAYGDGAFLTLGHGVVRVSVLPAIVGRIEIGELVLESPDIRVIRDARGLSIDSMLASAAEDEPAPEAETGSALALEVSSIRIDDGRLIFEDRTGEETVESVIDGIDLLAEDVGARRPLRFELEARLLGADTPNLTGEGTAGPVLGAGDAPVPFDVTFRVVDLSLADVVRLEDVAASLPPDTTLGGSLDASLEASGVPEDVRFDFALDAGAMDVVYGETFTKPAGVALALTAKGRALPAEASVEAFAFTLAGSTIEGEAKSALDETGAFDATARGRDVPLTGWGDLMPALAGLPVEGRLGLDVRARGSAASERLPTLGGALTLTDVAVRMPDTPPVEKLNARLDLSGAKAELRDTRFEVGGAPMQLEADVADLNAPELRFALDAPVLPLAALGVLEPGSEADDQLRRLRVVGRADLRGEDLEADARFASPEGRIQAIDYRALEGRASMTGTRMQLEEMTMKLLGGEVKLAGVLDQTEAEAPHFDGRVDIDGVRAEELIRARFPAAGDVASGQIHTSMSLSGQSLDDTDALLRSLAGTGRIGISDGVLRDINVAEEVLRGATGVPGLSARVSPR
ncbi:MAG: AsmA family protein, partial [Actinomycetota bacterium]|nr:AsmA family protein [Actinomycetota bacterium]